MECKICRVKKKNLAMHLMHKHNIQPSEYKKEYNALVINKNVNSHKCGCIPWNKGLSNEKTKAGSKKAMKTRSNNKDWLNNVRHSHKDPERNRKISEGRKKAWENPTEAMIMGIEKKRVKSLQYHHRKGLKHTSKPELIFMLLAERNNIDYESQVIIDNQYVVDFLIGEDEIVEINGHWHKTNAKILQDQLRYDNLTQMGYQVHIINVEKDFVEKIELFFERRKN